MSGAEFIAVLGITSSVVQIVDACAKILNRIQAFRQSLAFQDLVVQIPLLINVIEGLDTPKYRELLDEPTKQALARVLEGCLRQLRRLEKLIQFMTPLEAASKFEKTWKGIRSFGKDTKLREILGALTEYKSTITLHLSSVHVQNAQKPGTTSDAAKSYFDVPSSRLAHFVGRSEVFLQIQRAIDSSLVHPPVIVLIGAGGQGKTQVALEFCHRKASTFKGIFWIDSSSEVSATRSYEKILKSLKPETSSEESRDAKATVKSLLRSWKEPWLLVFDNFDSPNGFQTLPTFFPGANGSKKGVILVTSRQVSAARLGTSIPLTGLSEEGLELLLSRSYTVSKTDLTTQELIEGKEIVKNLGYLALAIDQAAAYISIRQLPLHMFTVHFEQRKEFILKATPESLWEYRTRTSEESGDGNQNLSVLTTWEMSFDQISESHEARTRIGDFLMQAAFFNPGAISEALFSNFHQYENEGILLWKLAFETDGVWDTFQFQDVVVGLVNLSLVQALNISSDGVVFSLHPLIKDWLQLRRELDARQRRTSTGIAMTSSLIQSFDREKLSLQTRQELLAHIDACVDNAARYLTSDEALVTYGGFIEGFQTTFATFYGDHDRYEDAEKLFLKSLILQQQKLGNENIATLSTLNNLGALYLDARQLGKAKASLDLALQVKEIMLGPDHPRTLNSVNNMGNLLALQMKYDEATQMYQRTLEGYSKIHGPMHKTVLESLNNLGEIAMKKGDLQKAEQTFKTAFTKARTLSEGKDDSLVLYIASNVALVYKLQRRYKEAVQIYADVVTGRERLLGAKHSSTLQSMCEVADVYTIIGDEESANEWYQKGNASLERRERGKPGAKREQLKLMVSRSTDSPSRNMESRPPTGENKLPLPPDYVTHVVDKGDQMEWKSSPPSKSAMTSGHSLAAVSSDLESRGTNPGQVERSGVMRRQVARYQDRVGISQYQSPQSTTYWTSPLQPDFINRGGVFTYNNPPDNPEVEIDTASQIDRVGYSISQLAPAPPVPQSIDRVGIPVPQYVSTIPTHAQYQPQGLPPPPPVPSAGIYRMGMAHWNNPPLNFGARQPDRGEMNSQNITSPSPGYIDRGFIGMSNTIPLRTYTAGSNHFIDHGGWPRLNLPGRTTSVPTGQLNPSAHPGSNCEYIARGGVCMHNVNHGN